MRYPSRPNDLRVVYDPVAQAFYGVSASRRQLFTLSALAAASGVPAARTISTTPPLTGGGDLSANRTLAISDFVASGASSARGAVPDPGATPGTTKFLREDATWAVPAGGGTMITGSAPAVLTGREGQFTLPITGLLAGMNVLIVWRPVDDEAEMDSIHCAAEVATAGSVVVHWRATGYRQGSHTFSFIGV
jgi:hypothetical protein